MPTILGFAHLNLTVTDLPESASWYRDVLGLKPLREVQTPDFARAILQHPASGMFLGLTSHSETGQGAHATEFRPGMDHVAFAVPDRADLEAWEQKLTDLRVNHSGIKRSRGGWLITLRDPDNIQLELYAPETTS